MVSLLDAKVCQVCAVSAIMLRFPSIKAKDISSPDMSLPQPRSTFRQAHRPSLSPFACSPLDHNVVSHARTKDRGIQYLPPPPFPQDWEHSTVPEIS